MSVEDVAREHYEGRSGLTDAISRLAEQVWRQVDPGDLDASWNSLGPRMVVGVAGAQLAAARSADDFADAALAEQGIEAGADYAVNPSMLSGIASDGRPLDSLLRNAITATKLSIASGATLERAMASGLASLDMIARTQVADAGRVADGAAITARRQVTGFIRVLSGRSCSRCVILAGRWYRWNAGFDRHPRCDCIGVPASENTAGDVMTNPRAYFESLTRAEQDKAFTIAGAQAIRDGADVGKVINARRGMATAGVTRTRIAADGNTVNVSIRRQTTRKVGGRDVFTTTEAAGRRVRIMPEEIYRQAGGDRDEAIRLLRSNGYLRDAAATRRQVAAPAARPAARPASEPAPKPVAKSATMLPPAPVPAHAPVKGRDVLAAEAERLNANPGDLKRIYEQARNAPFDAVLADLGARQGFDGTPQVVTRAELDAAVASGWTLVWRGVAQGRITAAQINAAFRTGAYEPGHGLYGNGYYFSERRLTAENYRMREPKTNRPAGGGRDFELSDLEGPEQPDSLLRVALNPAMRVIDYDELEDIYLRWYRSYPDGSPAAQVFADLGRFATSLGYDVIRVSGKHGDGGFYPGWEDQDDLGGAVQYVVLNRTVVMVQRAEDVP